MRAARERERLPHPFIRPVVGEMALAFLRKRSFHQVAELDSLKGEWRGVRSIA